MLLISLEFRDISSGSTFVAKYAGRKREFLSAAPAHAV
jgi:hypothetical protein